MKGMRGLFIACTVTCLITFLFAFIMKESSLELSDHRYVAAIATNEVNSLNKGNIVDLLSQYVQTNNISKVNLRQQKLHIDIKLQNQMAIEEQLLEEIPGLIQFSFFYVHNIEHLYVKVVEKSDAPHQQNTYLTLHISKDDEWLQQGVEALRQVNWLQDHVWLEQLRLKREDVS